jgi:hypothetical protein
MSKVWPWHHSPPHPFQVIFYCCFRPPGYAPPSWYDQFLVLSHQTWGGGGGRFTVEPTLSFFLSGMLVPHCSGQIPETGSLCGAVTHHTCFSLHGPDLLILTSSVCRYWPDSEVQLYLTWSVTHPTVGSSFRVKKGLVLTQIYSY